MAGDVIAPELVRAILERWVCSRKYSARPLAMPGADAIEVLAGLLERHRLVASRDAEIEVHSAKVGAVRRPIEEAVAATAELLDHQRRRGVNDLRQYDEVIAALCRVAALPACKAGDIGPGARWRQLVIAVRGDLWACLREVNPPLRPHAISHHGVYERFTAAIVPAITGETTTAATVAQTAMKLRAAGRWFDEQGRFGRIV